MTPRPDQHLVVIPAAGSSRRMQDLTRERPKSLIEVAGQPVLRHGLDVLAARGFSDVVIVTGYHADLLESTIGTRHGRLRIEYVRNADYATTEHGWSVYQAAGPWTAHGGPICLLDADNLYDPAILDRLLAHPAADVLAVDGELDTGEAQEELVLGVDGRVTGLVRDRSRAAQPLAGAFVGINRFSAGFTGTLFEAMATLFEAQGRGFKYERILHRQVTERRAELAYVDCAGLAWVNLNHATELPRAAQVAGLMGGKTTRANPQRA